MRDEAIEYWQSIQISPVTTLKDMLDLFRKEFAKEDLKEVGRYKWDQASYDPTTETFENFLKSLKKTAKQAFRNEADKVVKKFLFGKLPVKISRFSKNSLWQTKRRVPRRNQNVFDAQIPVPAVHDKKQTDPDKPKYNLKLVCQICGYRGHSARDSQKHNKNRRQELKRQQRPVNQMEAVDEDDEQDHYSDEDINQGF